MTTLYVDRRRVLLIDENSRRRNLLANVLRSREVEVHAADHPDKARSLWKNISYDLVLLAAQENTGQASRSLLEIRRRNPRQRIALLVGPPDYICEIGRLVAKNQFVSPVRDASPSRLLWPEIIQRVVSDGCVDQSVRFALNKLASPAAAGPPCLAE